jgi:multidrug efflux pump
LQPLRNSLNSVVDVNLKFNKPEVRVGINRDRAMALGVSAIDIAQTLQATFSGQRFDYFVMNAKLYQVIGQVQREQRDDPVDLKSLFVKNSRGELVQLDNLVTLTEESSPPALYRFDRFISATISAGLARGYTIGDGVDAMREVADKVLDESFGTALDGASKDFAESSSSLAFAFGLAIVLIYLVLAAQFESFRDPLTIIYRHWHWWRTHLQIQSDHEHFSQIRMIMLLDLITGQDLIIKFATSAVSGTSYSSNSGSSSRGCDRFMSLHPWHLPIALALGAGSESRVSMGIAVVGGLLLATALTLFVVPAVYTFIARKDSAHSGS